MSLQSSSPGGVATPACGMPELRRRAATSYARRRYAVAVASLPTGTPPFPRSNAGRGRQGAAATSRHGRRGDPPRPMLRPGQDGAAAARKEVAPAASSTGRVAGAALPRSRMPTEWSAVQARCAAQQQEEQRVAAEAKLKTAGRRWGQRPSCRTRQSGRGRRGCDNSSPGTWRVLSSQGSRQTGRQGLAGQRGGAAKNGKVAVLADGDEMVPEPCKEVKVASTELLEAATESGGVAMPLSATGDMVAAVYDAMASADEQDHVQLQAMMDSVVKVFCVHTEPNFSLPWQRLRQCSSTSSGFAVECNGRRCLLTNAHSVEYFSQVKVKRRGDDRKFGAKVLSVGTECDIAMLEVEDEEFWHGLDPLELGPLPRLQQQVAVIGYPVGGETISVTTGVVSRIEVTPYVHGSTELLGVQIDAAINSGNSGGPVFTEDGQCCGIAFQSLAGLGDAENIGYVIPTPIIEHFLADYQRNGSFTGFPSIGIEWQAMDSQALRAHYKMTAGQKGVLVRRVNTIAPSAKVLRADDVVMEFDGVQVASDGTVPFGTGERIAFSYLISEKFTGDKVKLKILRGSEEQLVEVELSRPPPMVPAHINNEDPSYFVVSGLVFTPCTERYLESEYNSVWEAPVTLQYSIHNLRPKQQGEQVVLLSQVLATAETVGYEDYNNMRVHRFNGQDVSNLKQLARLVVGCEEPFLHFELDYNRVLVLENKSAKASTVEVLRLHNIPRAMSCDIEDHLEAQPPLQDRPRRRVPPEQGESGKMAVAVNGTDAAGSAAATADAGSGTGGAGDALVVDAAAEASNPSSDTAGGGAGSSTSSSGQK